MTTRSLIDNFAKFQEEMSQGSGPYFKMKDIPENKAITIRFLPWVVASQIVEALPHYEGWADRQVKDNNGNIVTKPRPIRFHLDEAIPENMTWSVGTGQYDLGKVKSPDGVVAAIVWNSHAQRVQLASFSQSTLISKIMGWVNPNSETYMGGELYDVDIVLTKKKTHKVEYSLEPKVKSKPLVECPNILAALGEFSSDGFSFDEYMSGGNPFSGPNMTETGIKVYGKATKQQPTHQPAGTQSEQPADNDGYFPTEDWRTQKTPTKGTPLGSLTLEQLMKTRDALKKNHPLYQFVVMGIEELSNPDIDEGEVEIPF
jgi:hypothetical protein